MSAMSNYLEDALVNHVLRNTAFTTPGDSIYVGLIKFYESSKLETGDDGQEASGGAYARVQVNGTSKWDDPSGGGATHYPEVVSRCRLYIYKNHTTLSCSGRGTMSP